MFQVFLICVIKRRPSGRALNIKQRFSQGNFRCNIHTRYLIRFLISQSLSFQTKNNVPSSPPAGSTCLDYHPIIYYEVLGKSGPTLFGSVANWTQANRAPANRAPGNIGAANWFLTNRARANWATAKWAPANRAPADWAHLDKVPN